MRAVAWSCVVLLAACGTSTAAGADLDADTTTDAQLTDAVGGTDAGGTDAAANDTVGADAVADVAADAAASCGSFTTPPVGAATDIVVVNKTANNLYLGLPAPTCSGFLGYTLTGADGTPLVASYGACQFTCTQLQTQGCGCPPVACQPALVTLVAPGHQFDFGWTGTIFAAETMATACYQQATCANGPCLHELAAPQATVIHVSAFSQAVCNGAPCQDCTPGASGNCTIAGGSTTGGTELKASATWNGAAQVQLTFQ